MVAVLLVSSNIIVNPMLEEQKRWKKMQKRQNNSQINNLTKRKEDVNSNLD